MKWRRQKDEEDYYTPPSPHVDVVVIQDIAVIEPAITTTGFLPPLSHVIQDTAVIAPATITTRFPPPLPHVIQDTAVIAPATITTGFPPSFASCDPGHWSDGASHYHYRIPSSFNPSSSWC